jgi:hypothetical protein
MRGPGLLFSSQPWIGLGILCPRGQRRVLQKPGIQLEQFLPAKPRVYPLFSAKKLSAAESAAPATTCLSTCIFHSALRNPNGFSLLARGGPDRRGLGRDALSPSGDSRSRLGRRVWPGRYLPDPVHSRHYILRGESLAQLEGRKVSHNKGRAPTLFLYLSGPQRSGDPAFSTSRFTKANQTSKN